MEQVFRIEIPVEVIDKTDAASLQRLETALQRISIGIKQNKAAATEAFSAIDRAAADAATSMDKVGSAASDAASEAGSANNKLEDSVSDVGDAYEGTASAAMEAGQKSGSALNSASNSADKFAQRVEKTNKTLRGMFKERFKLIMEALDKASPVLKSIWNSAKGLVSKTWSVAVRMKDFVTAPFRKLYSWISSPITIALSVAGIGLSANDLVTTYNDFETGMSGVRALTGATNEEFTLLKETAKELGADTAFSASEAAVGMQNLASAGFTTNEIVSAMPGMLDLAASSGTDLATASDIAATTLRGFGLEASQAAHVADVLAEAAARTNAEVADTGEAMKYIAPVAHAMGMSLEEVAASVGVLSDAGIKGSQAGTTLRSALSRLSKPTSDMQKVMKKLGLSFYDSSGQMKSISSIVGMLKANMAGLTAEQQQNALVTLFGQEAMSGMMVLLEAGSEKLDELTRSFEQCEGTASEMANVRLDNLAGDLEEMGGALETAKLEIMDKLNPYLREGVQWLTTKIPAIQEKIEQLIDTGIAKAKQLKDFLAGVFRSADFKNADGIIDKFFIAWDKIIAEPFNEWWSNGGQEAMLGAISKFGKSAGELLHGIVTGVFAALKGEEIDFEGLNITGIAKAGAQMAKEFVSAFMSSLNLGDLAGGMPGLMKAGLFGFSAFKVGSGVFSAVKTFGKLKNAFSGLTGAATKAAPAVASVGAKAATSAAGIGKASTVLGGLKTALAAIPTWGWVAAAALTALGAGYAIYRNAQSQHEQQLLHAGDAVQEAATAYETSAKRVNDAVGTIESIKEVKLKIANNSEENQVQIAQLKAELAGIENREIELKAKLADGTLTKEQIAEYQAELDKLQGREVWLKARIAENSVAPEKVKEYASQLAILRGREEEIKVELASDTLSKDKADEYMRELEIIKSREEKLSVKLEGLGLTAAGISLAASLMQSIDGKEAEVSVVLAKGSLSKDEIEAYKTELAGIYTRQAEINLQRAGAALTVDEVKQYRDALNGIKSREAELTLKIAEGGLNQTKLKELREEYESLKTKQAAITLMLSGQELTAEQLKKITAEYNRLDNRKAEITANLNESGLSLDELQQVSDAMKMIGDKSVVLDFAFADGGLKTEDLKAYNKQLEDLYAHLVEISNGQITQEDVDAGRVTEERVQQVYDTLEAESNARLNELEASLIRNRQLIPELVEKRGEYQQQYTEDSSRLGGISAAKSEAQEIFAKIRELNSELAKQQAKLNVEEISQKQYEDWFTNTYKPGMLEQQRLYGENVESRVDVYKLSKESEDSFLWMFDDGVNYDKDIIKQIEQKYAEAKKTSEANTEQYDAYNDQLKGIYGGEVSLITGRAFKGTAQAGMSLEEIAAGYSAHDAASQQMFQNAVMALRQLNRQTDYLAESDKTQAVDVVEIAAKAEVIQNVKQQLQDLQAASESLSDGESAAALNGVNEALNALGLTEASGLGELSTAIEALNGLDLSAFSLTDAQVAFVALGGDASGCKTQVDGLLSSLRALDGLTATATISVTYGGAAYLAVNQKAQTNANGGIYDGAMLSWVAEDGPEAIIPLGSKRRSRGLDLWLQAGEMLGVTEFAGGGILSPYSGAMENLPDVAWDDDDGDGKPKPIQTTGSSIGSGGNSFSVSVAANPVFQIEGGEADSILDKLKDRQRELAEIFGSAIAEQLEDIVANMV